ncbi:21832_t:CDS:2, partial [Gigaspora rosea]
IIVHPSTMMKEHVKASNQSSADVLVEPEVMSFSKAIETMTNVLYKCEVTQKLTAFQKFGEFRNYIEAENVHLTVFFEELVSSTNLFKKTLYLDSTGTADATINALAELGITSTTQTVWRIKNKISNNHLTLINNNLDTFHESALVLNVDDYHNIYTNRVPNENVTSTASNMTELENQFIISLGTSFNELWKNQVINNEEETMKPLTVHSYNLLLKERINV